MAYHRYVLHATPEYLKEYNVFPPNQCVFITHEDDSPIFRGAFSVPTLAGTQDSNFLSNDSVKNAYSEILSSAGRNQLKLVKTHFVKNKTEFATVEEIKKNTEEEFGANPVVAPQIRKHLLNKIQTRKDAFPFALTEDIQFAGVSIHSNTFSMPLDSLVEVPAIVSGVATIFPRPDGGIPICEKYVPGEIYYENVPLFKETQTIKIGKILDFPNPHSLRVVINVANQEKKDA